MLATYQDSFSFTIGQDDAASGDRMNNEWPVEDNRAVAPCASESIQNKISCQRPLHFGR